MGVTQRDLYKEEPIYARADTPGGMTYYLGAPDGSPICMSPLKELGKREQYCSHTAGTGTDHLGTGRCKWHGGNAGTYPSHGRYAIMADTQLRDVYQAYLDDPDLMDMRPELALLRTILFQVVQEARRDVNRGMIAERTVRLSLSTVEAIGRAVERMDKAQARHILTIASIRMMMARAVDTAGQFVPGDQMAAFLDAWEQDVMGAFASVELLEAG